MEGLTVIAAEMLLFCHWKNGIVFKFQFITNRAVDISIIFRICRRQNEHPPSSWATTFISMSTSWTECWARAVTGW